MSETDLYIQKLIVSNPLMEPVYKDVIRAMELLPESRGLDVGWRVTIESNRDLIAKDV